MNMITITTTIITIMDKIMDTATIMDTIIVMIMRKRRSLWQARNLTGINMMMIITTIITTTVTTMTMRRKKDAHSLKSSGHRAGKMKIPSRK